MDQLSAMDGSHRTKVMRHLKRRGVRTTKSRRNLTDEQVRVSDVTDGVSEAVRGNVEEAQSSLANAVEWAITGYLLGGEVRRVVTQSRHQFDDLVQVQQIRFVHQADDCHVGLPVVGLHPPGGRCYTVCRTPLEA